MARARGFVEHTNNFKFDTHHCCCLCPWIVIPILVIFTAILAAGPGGYVTRSGVFDLVSKSINIMHTPATIERTIQNSMLFHPTLSHRMLNGDYDMCYDPYNCVCNYPAEQSISSLVLQNDIEIINDITQNRMTNTSFMRECKRFHSMPVPAKYEILSTRRDVMRILSEIYRGDSVMHCDKLQLLRGIRFSHMQKRTYNDWYDLMSNLHSYGIREPFHIIRLRTEDIQVAQPARFYRQLNEETSQYVRYHIKTSVGSEGCKQTSKIPTMEEANYLTQRIRTNYEIISDSIYSKVIESKIKFLKVKDIESRLQFQLGAFMRKRNSVLPSWIHPSNEEVMETSVFVDPDALARFHRALDVFSEEQWNDYLWFASCKSILHQHRMLVNANERICDLQVVEYFPVSVCRKFKASMNIRGDLDILRAYVLTSFKSIVIDENLFEFPPQIHKHVLERFETLELLINRCTTNKNNETVTELERRYLNNPSLSKFNYMDYIFSMIRESDFQERRNLVYDDIYTNIYKKILVWNARYDDSTNAMVIGPGLLNFPHKFAKIGGCQYHSTTDPGIFHEFGHFLFPSTKHFQGSIPNIEWERFVHSIARRYQSGFFPVSDFVNEENVADNVGLIVALTAYIRKARRSDDEIRCFIVSYIRQWCPYQWDNAPDNDKYHAKNRARAVIPLVMIRNEFNRVYNCTKNDGFISDYLRR